MCIDKCQEIDISILNASLKAVDLKLSKQLDVIMSWNRPDVAKKHISIQGNEYEVNITCKTFKLIFSKFFNYRKKS